jgi:hypothetical protein
MMPCRRPEEAETLFSVVKKVEKVKKGGTEYENGLENWYGRKWVLNWE